MINLICNEKHYGYLGDYVNAILAVNTKIAIKLITYQESADLTIPVQKNDWYIFFQIIPEIWLTFPNTLKRTIVINTEQLTRPEWAKLVESYLDLGIKVFDYDLFQSNILNHKRHKYLPYPVILSENQGLSQLIQNTPKIYDVVLCASPSPRRTLIQDQLIQLGLTVKNIQGTQLIRDQQLAQGRILLNIHFDPDYRVFEHLRCDRWILAGMMVVSEDSCSDPESDLKSLLTVTNYENLTQIIVKMINNYNYYHKKHQKKLKLYQSSIISARNSRCNKLLKKLAK